MREVAKQFYQLELHTCFAVAWYLQVRVTYFQALETLI